MKNKIAIASAFIAASSLATAEIVINDFLSFEGFIDMSYQHGDIDSDDVSVASGSDNSFQVDQVEIDWLFDFDPVTAQIDLAYYGSDAAGNAGFDNEGDVIVEQAFATYHFEGDFEGSAVTAGRFASMLGFEAFEPTGLYQFSFAYDYSILPGYSEGVKYTYESDNTFFGASILSSYADDQGYTGRLGGSGDSNWAAEIAGAYSMDNGVSLFLGGYYTDADADNDFTNDSNVDGETWVINAYATFETGAWLFAAEVNYGDSESGAFGLDAEDGTLYGSTIGGAPYSINSDDATALSGLLMANYAYSEQGSVTARLSYEERSLDNATAFSGSDPAFPDVDAGDVDAEQYKATLAHSWAFTDNLLLVTEISYIDGESDLDNGLEDEDFDGVLGAVELLFSF